MIFIRNFFIIMITISLLFDYFSCLQLDCNTPIECYIKALDVLKKDRVEMYRITDQLEKKTDDLEKSMQGMLGEIKQQIETEIISVIKSLEDKLIKNNEKIISLEQEITNIKLNNQNKHYMYKEALIFQNIVEALEKGTISKMGNPVGWDELTHRINDWEKYNGKNGT